MKKHMLLLLGILMFSPLSAQNNILGVDDDILKVNESIGGDFGIALMPQYAITQGMRIDFDFKIANHQYITIGPQWYYAKDSQRFYRNKVDMSGAGINVNYRYFFSESRLPSGPYVGFGLHYKFMNLNYDDYNWISYTESGNTFYRDEYGTRELNVQQGGYDILMGYQIAFNRFLMDFYIGWAFRVSDYDSEEYGSDWNETIFEPGYEGFLPTGGIRIGFFLK